MQEIKKQYETLINFIKEENLEENPVLYKDIDYIELSPRPLRILKENNILTVYQLTILNKKELLEFPDMGKKSLNDIKCALSIHGLSIKE